MIGKKFGKWLVISLCTKEESPRRGIHYKAQCECGTIKICRREVFLNGKSIQCKNCRLKQIKKIGYFPGQQVNNWTIIQEKYNQWAERHYLCRCICGNERLVRLRDLEKNKSKQCSSCKVRERNYTHRDSKSRTHKIWAGIKQRCLNPKNESYKWYGGRGINLYGPWHEYKIFLKDMGPCPENMTIDRIDPNGNYEPNNCKWVTKQENQKNRRNSSSNFDKFIYAPKNKLCKQCLANLVNLKCF